MLPSEASIAVDWTKCESYGGEERIVAYMVLRFPTYTCINHYSLHVHPISHLIASYISLYISIYAFMHKFSPMQ